MGRKIGRISVAERLDAAEPGARELLLAYLEERSAVLNPATIDRLRVALADWLMLLAARGVSPCAAKRADCLAQVARWSGGGIAASSVAGAMSSCRGFHAWLMQNDLATKNPWDRLQGPRIPQRLPHYLEPGELHELDLALRRPDVRGLRDLSLFRFLVSTGCRINEALTIEASALSLDKAEARVFGKFSKERIVFLSPPAVEALRLWLRVGRPLLARGRSARNVWLGRNGGPLDYSEANAMLAGAAVRARLGKNVTPHMLRHTAATLMLRGGANLRVVQDMLGHARLDSTRIYTHLTAEDVRQAHANVMGRIMHDAAY